MHDDTSNDESSHDVQLLARLCALLAAPGQLRIVRCLLVETPDPEALWVGEIAENASVSQSLVTTTLQRLLSLQLVSNYRSGKYSYWLLTPLGHRLLGAAMDFGEAAAPEISCEWLRACRSIERDGSRHLTIQLWT